MTALIPLVAAGVVALALVWFLVARRGERLLEARQAAWAERSDREAAQAAARRAEDLKALSAARAELEASRAATAAAETAGAATAADLRAEVARLDARVAELSQGQRAIAATSAADVAAADARSRTTLEEARTRLDVERERHAAQVTQLTGRVRTLAAVCLVDPDMLVRPATFKARPAATELEEIVRRVRGMAFVDAATIADASGLSLGRGQGRDADDLAALVPAVARAAQRLEPVFGATTSVMIATEDSRTAELRALPRWTNGAWLAAASSAQRPPAPALDGASAFAYQLRGELVDAPPPRTFSARGRLGAGARTQALTVEVERESAGLGCQLMAIVRGPQLLAGVVDHGPTTSQLELLLGVLHDLQRGARAALQGIGISQLELVFAGGVRVGLASITASARLGLVTLHRGAALEPLVVERVAGRLRRFLDDAAAAVEEAA